MRGGIPTLVLRLSITLGLLVLLVFFVADPAELLARLGAARPGPMVLAVALSALDRVLMAYKWSLLLAARGVAVGLWTATRAYFASSLVGLVLPVTVGADAVRVLALRQIGMLEVTASIVIERGIGVIAMASVALMSVAILATTLSQVAVQPLVTWLVVVGGLGTLGFVASLLVADRWASRQSASTSRLGRAIGAYGRYRRHPLVLGVFYGLSIGESLLSAVIAWVVASGLGVPVPLYVCVATVPLALAVARLPISLGGFGVQEASFVYLAGLLGVPSTEALSIMLVTDLAMLLALLPAAFDSEMLGLRRQPLPTRVL